jgi:small-conductance mechanosensitive channel
MNNQMPDKSTDANPQEPAEQGKQAASEAAKTNTTLLTGCLAAFIGLPLLLFLISAVIGLVTGNLYYFGRRGETYHGALARIISGVILIIAALVVLIVLKTRKKARAQNR